MVIGRARSWGDWEKRCDALRMADVIGGIALNLFSVIENLMGHWCDAVQRGVGWQADGRRCQKEQKWCHGQCTCSCRRPNVASLKTKNQLIAFLVFWFLNKNIKRNI